MHKHAMIVSKITNHRRLWYTKSHQDSKILNLPMGKSMLSTLCTCICTLLYFCMLTCTCTVHLPVHACTCTCTNIKVIYIIIISVHYYRPTMQTSGSSSQWGDLHSSPWRSLEDLRCWVEWQPAHRLRQLWESHPAPRAPAWLLH